MTSLRYSNFLCPLGIVMFSMIVSSVDRYMLRCAVCAGLGWAGLRWAGLGCAVLGCAALCCAVVCYVQLCIAFRGTPRILCCLLSHLMLCRSNNQPAACMPWGFQVCSSQTNPSPWTAAFSLLHAPAWPHLYLVGILVSAFAVSANV